MRAMVLAMSMLLCACEPDPYEALRLAPYYGNETGHEIIDSGFYVSSGEEPYWLDNENVLVLAVSTFSKKFSGKKGEWPGYRLAVWNIESGEHTVLHENSPESLCYDGEKVFFNDNKNSRKGINETGYDARLHRDATGKYVLTHIFQYDYEGRYHSEGKAQVYRKWRKLIFECKKFSWKRPEKGDYYRVLTPWKALLTIEARVGNELRAIQFEAAENEERLISVSPFKVLHLKVPHGLHYVSSLDRYLVQYHERSNAVDATGASAGKGRLLVAWWLYPDGNFEKIDLPAQWRFGDVLLYTRVGWVHVGADRRLEDRSYKNDGLFLADDKGIRRLIYGQIQGINVSPDACKLAFYHRPTWRSNEGNESLKVIKLC